MKNLPSKWSLIQWIESHSSMHFYLISLKPQLPWEFGGEKRYNFTNDIPSLFYLFNHIH
jgi:hypothetical protein